MAYVPVAVFDRGAFHWRPTIAIGVFPAVRSACVFRILKNLRQENLICNRCILGLAQSEGVLLGLTTTSNGAVIAPL